MYLKCVNNQSSGTQVEDYPQMKRHSVVIFESGCNLAKPESPWVTHGGSYIQPSLNNSRAKLVSAFTLLIYNNVDRKSVV